MRVWNSAAPKTLDDAALALDRLEFRPGALGKRVGQRFDRARAGAGSATRSRCDSSHQEMLDVARQRARVAIGQAERSGVRQTRYAVGAADGGGEGGERVAQEIGVRIGARQHAAARLRVDRERAIRQRRRAPEAAPRAAAGRGASRSTSRRSRSTARLAPKSGSARGWRDACSFERAQPPGGGGEDRAELLRLGRAGLVVGARVEHGKRTAELRVAERQDKSGEDRSGVRSPARPRRGQEIGSRPNEIERAPARGRCGRPDRSASAVASRLAVRFERSGTAARSMPSSAARRRPAATASPKPPASGDPANRSDKPARAALDVSDRLLVGPVRVGIVDGLHDVQARSAAAGERRSVAAARRRAARPRSRRACASGGVENRGPSGSPTSTRHAWQRVGSPLMSAASAHARRCRSACPQRQGGGRARPLIFHAAGQRLRGSIQRATRFSLGSSSTFFAAVHRRSCARRALAAFRRREIPAPCSRRRRRAARRSRAQYQVRA